MSVLGLAVDDWSSDHSTNDYYKVVVTQQLMAIQGVLLCALEALSSDTPLSQAEAEVVYGKAKCLLSKFQDHWHSLDWWHVLASSKLDGTLLRYSVARELLDKLLRWTPFRDLCSDPRSCTVIPEEFADTLDKALSEAKDVRIGRGLSKLPIEDALDAFASTAVNNLRKQMAAHRKVCLPMPTAVQYFGAHAHSACVCFRSSTVLSRLVLLVLKLKRNMEVVFSQLCYLDISL